MTRRVLGVSAFFHDSAAALLEEGRLVAAVEEERFSRVKHDPAFPAQAVDWLLDLAGVRGEAGALEVLAFYEKPLIKFDRVLVTAAAAAPAGLRRFLRTLPRSVRERLLLPARLEDAVPEARRQVFVPHHLSHAASAFYPSPFEEAAILTVDGVGEWSTATQGVGRGRDVALDRELRWPHSVGMLYSAFTAYLGFRVNNGEYKVMGLAPYGEPRFVDAIREHLVDVRPDGSIRLNLRYFPYTKRRVMFDPALAAVLGGPPREPEGPMDQRHKDVARSIQVVTEEIVTRMARDLHARTGQRNLVMAGGVALNSVANGRLLREGPFEGIWVQPAAGDAGGALGAALLAWHGVDGHPREPDPGIDGMRAALLGPTITGAEARAALTAAGAAFEALDDATLFARVAALLDEGRVVAWARGPMEFGPRALGCRSILADARRAEMRDRVNHLVKKREGFRPFAPAVLAAEAGRCFELDRPSPYMLFVVPARADGPATPATTHVDGSARVQTVHPEHHGDFHALIEAFHARTGCPVILNTSFNVRGEPIVRTAEDAVRCYLGTGLDALVVGDCLTVRPASAP